VAADASGSTIQPSSENSTADSRTQVGKYDSGCHWIRASSAVIPFSLEFVILAPASGHVISEERSCKAQEVVLTRYIESASAANSISNYKPCPYLYQAPAAPLTLSHYDQFEHLPVKITIRSRASQSHCPHVAGLCHYQSEQPKIMAEDILQDRKIADSGTYVPCLPIWLQSENYVQGRLISSG